MKYKLLSTFLIIAGVSLSFVCKAQSTLQVIGLQCEYLNEPLGLDVMAPRFSWKLTDKSNARGQKQTAFQVLVASSKSLLDKNKGDIWNSGIITSGQSVLIDYKGTALTSNQVCYWKVRAYDIDKKASAWSLPTRFSMGLLSPGDWKGSWIKHPDAPYEDHIWFRKNINLKENLASAFIHVASLGYHELYINGKKVDDRILAPVLTRLDKRVLYVTYDIKSLLKKGNNTVAIWYGPGWARYEYFAKTIFPSFRVQLDAKTLSGADYSLSTDASWKCQISSSKNTGQNKYTDHGGEYIDARKYIAYWNAVGYDDSGWPAAKETSLNVTLSAETMEPTRIIENIPVKAITDTIPGIYKVDMGKNFTGWIEVKMNGMAAGDVVTIMVADDPISLQDFTQKNIYVCKGTPGESFTNRFNYGAGRFINIRGLKQKPSLTDIKGFAISTDIKRTGFFTCSDELFNQIYETDLWTYRMCTTEGYTSDCPHRERLGYGEEVWATSWGIGLPNYEVGSFYFKHVRDWVDVQEKNGWINHTAPQWNEHYGGPMWCSAGLNLSWEFYQTYGDKRILENIYDSGKKWLEFLNLNSPGGLLKAYMGGGKFLGDWAAPGGRKEFGDSKESLYFNNCVYAMNLETVIKIAGILGKPEDVALYQPRLNVLKEKIQTTFFNPGKNIYMNGNQVQTAFVLWRGIVPENLKPIVMDNFRKLISNKDAYFDMGSSGLPVLLNFLTEDRQYNEAVSNILVKTNQPSYGFFIKYGETTWPEYWTATVPSQIHTCFTGIASWFMKSVAGIHADPAHPGYQSFIISPGPVSNLTFANAKTESLYGEITSNWRKDGKKFRLLVTIPVNSQATVYLPAKEGKTVLENEVSIDKAKGIKMLKREGDILVLEVLSGHYTFDSEL